jgi:stage V sporulation protein B
MGHGVVVILLFGQSLIIKAFGWDDNYRFVLYGFAISPIFVGVTGAIKGYFQGMQKMAPSAIGQLLENLMKVIVGIGLVVILLDLGLPLPIATAGAAVGASFGFIASAIYMVFKYKKMRVEIQHQLTFRCKSTSG